MKKRNYLWISALCAMMTVLSTSCSNDDDPAPENPDTITKTTGVYVLNSGKWNGNNSTLDFYNPETKTLTSKVFFTENGRGLGDTANDMLIYGSKMYIAVSISNIIEITDLNGKSLKTISPKDDAGIPQQPRKLESYNGKVYVTLFDGHLACIDTTTLEITKKVKVGANPEAVCQVNGKLYVANSGAYNTVSDSTLSVVDAATFVTSAETKKVVINPTVLSKDSEGDLYILSMGNYKDIKNTLQRMDAATGKVETICNATAFTICKDIIYAYYSQWGDPNVKFIKYDAKNEKILTENFITDGTVLNNLYSISSDPVNGNIYISTSDYVNTGDVYVFSAEGKLLHNFGTSGLNPIGAFFVTSK